MTQYENVETVLLVEDNPDDVFLMRRVFKKAQIKARLVVVTNGKQAVSYLVAIILVLASLPVEWVELKNAPITYSSPFGSSDGRTVAAMSVTGLNGFFKPLGISVPVWILVLISEIGLLLSLCRSMRWADAPRMLCVVPLALLLAFVVIEWSVNPPELARKPPLPKSEWFFAQSDSSRA